MARVLLTGSSGGVGRAARPVLEAAGWAVRPFDLTDGKDLRDEAAVLRAMNDCEAVVHAGAIAHDSAGTPAEIVATNLLARTRIPTIVLRPVMILTDPALLQITETDAELGAFVHADDVATAVLRALSVKPDGHLRLTLCGPGQFDTSATRQILGWTPTRGWPSRCLPGHRK